jgi:hypothetical protein
MSHKNGFGLLLAWIMDGLEIAGNARMTVFKEAASRFLDDTGTPGRCTRLGCVTCETSDQSISERA